MVDESLAGANSTILAYGQTGSGKTHTVLGQVKNNPLEDDLLTPESGLFMRVLKDLFEYKKRREEASKDRAYVVIALSCIEIYVDKVRDLLSERDPKAPKQEIRVVVTDEDVTIPDLRRYEILNLNDVYKHFQTASSQRTSRSTKGNLASSRSHCLFFIDILQQEMTDKNPSQPSISFLSEGVPKQKKPPKRKGPSAASPKAQSPNDIDAMANVYYKEGEPPIYCSKITLVDLAGSEKSDGKSGSGATVGSQAHVEMTSINLSLTTLGNVAHALHTGAPHVAYRSSTLTKILRPSFASPNAKILLISNLSPSQLTYAESRNTLDFANKVKAMKVNQGMIGAEQQQLQFDYLDTQILNWQLLADLHIANTTFYSDPMLRRYTDVIVPPFNTHRFRLKGQEKDRQKLLRSLESVGHEEKMRINEKIKAQEAKVAEEMTSIKKEIYDGLIDEYTNKIGDLQEKIEKLTVEASEFEEKLNNDINVMVVETKDHEKESDKLSKEKRELRTSIESGQTELEKLIEERAALNEKEKKSSKEDNLKLSAADKELSESELAYANDTWKHCKAQEYYYKFKAYRETQLSLFAVYKQNILRIDQAIKESKKLSTMLKSK
eukprot:TRINITY_DN3803_c1_g1_i3.p1 TRINITY_DN3803_c1_g1~~TRINITY_DN3803_c1_g1_i3.p1  ORF type:complete len:608 (+),score=134.95 TRINITY_DN3803_c1_g1_i3:368-2191(+)